jgi:hypothetical protein
MKAEDPDCHPIRPQSLVENDWVSVADWLPETGTNVFVWPQRIIVYFGFEIGCSVERAPVFFKAQHVLKGITHWRRLPAGPKP